MTTEERISMISAKRVNINNAEIAKKNAEEILRSQLIAKVLDMGKRIESIIAIGNALKENGFLYSSTMLNRDDNRLHPYGYEHEVLADGFTHHTGLFGRCLEYSTKSIEYMGIEMGGACGMYDFVTDGTTVKSVHKKTKQTQEIPVRHLQQFLAEFPVYEKAFYAWVDANMA